MRGHITWRRSSWYIVYSEPQAGGGKSVQRWRGGFRTKREAEQALSGLQSILNPRGRPPRSDDEYRRVARTYLAKLAERLSENRGTRGILLDTAAELGMPRGTLKGWLWQARRLGFLSDNTPGPRLRTADKAGVMQADHLA